MKRRTLIVTVLIATGLAVWISVHFWPRSGKAKFNVTSAGPLDIRLWGIRPNAGDTIYDPNGKRLKDCVGIGMSDHGIWMERYRRFDFVFELPDTNEIPLFLKMPRVSVGGEGNRLRWKLAGFSETNSAHLVNYNGQRLLCVNGSLEDSFRRPGPFKLWYRDIPLDVVDVELDYYCDSRGDAEFVLEGPFEPGTTVVGEDSRHKVVFAADSNESDDPGIRLRWFGGSYSSDPVFAYDNQGVRHSFRRKKRYTSDPNGYSADYQCASVRYHEISTILFGEHPHRIRFNNIDLGRYRDARGNHSAWLDEMAERLDLELSPRELNRYKFKDANEALKVADIVCGSKVRQAARTIVESGVKRGRIGSAKLTEDQARTLRQAAQKWARAIEPCYRQYGVEIGLRCGWSEFVEPAFELLDYPTNYTQYSYYSWNWRYRISTALAESREHLSDETLERIKRRILSRPQRDSLSNLKKCLLQTGSAARIKTAWELAEDDRPWLWYDAFETLARWREFEGRYDSLPDKLKLRAYLVLGSRRFSNAEKIAPKAYSLLPDLLTPELRFLDERTFSRLLKKVAEKLDHDTATGAMINYMRRTLNHRDANLFIDRIVRYINFWHGLNIGGLGSDTTESTKNRSKLDWSKIAAEAIEWYDSKYKAADSNSVR